MGRRYVQMISGQNRGARFLGDVVRNCISEIPEFNKLERNTRLAESR